MQTFFVNKSERVQRLTGFAASVLLIALSTWLSKVLNHATLDLPMFSIHAGLTLGLAVRYGMGLALAGSLGTALCMALSGDSLLLAALAPLPMGLGAACAATVFRRAMPLFKSELARRLGLMLCAALVFGPILAGGHTLMYPALDSAWDGSGAWFAFSWAVFTFNAMLFTPLALSWVPHRRKAKQGSEVSRYFSYVTLGVISLTLLGAHILGLERLFLAGQMVLIAALVMAMIPAFVGSQRASATTIAIVVTFIVVQQAEFINAGASLLQMTPRERILFVACLLFGVALVGHLLNAVSLRSARQQWELKNQVMKNPFSGLLNRRYFFKVLNEVTNDKQRQTELLAEIAIPDLNYWADFSGREAAYQFDARIAERIDFALKDYAHFVAHAVFGSYFARLKSTADPLAVIETIESAVREACSLHGIKGMKLRPQVALLRVPRDVQANTEDILSSLSHALQKSSLTLKRWSMASLQQGKLEMQRLEAHENEQMVESLSVESIAIFTQTILPIQGQSDSGLHFEVLARLKNAGGQFISPARFLPVYATCGLLPQFDRKVIQSLFETFEVHPDLTRRVSACSINLTGPTLSDPDLVAFIEAQFAGALIKPSQIVFEITESDQISNLMQALENVEELRRMGASIALDDFGTGLASFDYLKRFKPDWIKIDGSFVRSAMSSALNAEVVSSMVKVANAAGSQVVTEQVEDRDSIELMRRLGAHFVQGYAVSKPRPIEELIAELQSSASARGERSESGSLNAAPQHMEPSQLQPV